MKQNNHWKLIAAAIGMLVLILDSKTALLGAAKGVEICLYTVVPSLLPFFFFSILLTSTISGMDTRLLRPIGKLFRLPAGSEPIYLIGLLGGYPVGAQCVSQAVDNGSLSPDAGAKMLAYCNNCGPAFLFGIIGSFFPEPWMIWALWLIHILSSMFLCIFLSDRSTNASSFSQTPVSVVSALKQSLWIMAQVCGWIVLFRMGITFIDRWFGFYLHPTVKTALYGFLELANGCLSLDAVSDIGQRFVLCSALIAAGGLCVTMQTFGVVSPTISKRYYIPGKLTQMSISIVLAGIVNVLFIHGKVGFMPLICGICLLFTCVVFFRKAKKGVEIYPVTVYNAERMLVR